ncbi:hypothetical protein HDE_03174 [Halotydeus destructor]|nr:hypothetical protein HDE_03174 [Halotydeus destructor]
MEMTRPLTNCAMCSGIDDFLILTNPTRQQFADYAYSGRPTIVRQSTANWTAMHLFNYTFFQTVYSTIAGAHEAVENECQFFPFRTSFVKLREVFEMPAERVNLTDTSQTWYIGWSNCNPDVAAELRRHYQRPHFLPLESESSAIDWIFMGHSGQGASMHMDYVFRPSWQAQISGRKSWHLLPPPECEHLCPSLRTTVSKGDIILVDTNQWYHDTFIHPGELSITIGSEYD